MRRATACEAMTWVACRKELTTEVERKREFALLYWREDQEVRDKLAMLEGLARPNPCCPIDFECVPRSENDPTRVPVLRRVPMSPHELAQWAADYMCAENLSPEAAAAAFRADIERRRADRDRRADALDALVKAAGENALTAEGRLAFDFGRPNPNALPVPIPSCFWRVPDMHLRYDGWALPRRTARWEGPTYCDVTFLWDELTARWPARSDHARLALEWMEREVPSAIKLGRRLKRDDAINRCRHATGCTDREARAAWGSLPDHVRKRRRRR